MCVELLSYAKLSFRHLGYIPEYNREAMPALGELMLCWGEGANYNDCIFTGDALSIFICYHRKVRQVMTLHLDTAMGFWKPQQHPKCMSHQEARNWEAHSEQRLVVAAPTAHTCIRAFQFAKSFPQTLFPMVLTIALPDGQQLAFRSRRWGNQGFKTKSDLHKVWQGRASGATE